MNFKTKGLRSMYRRARNNKILQFANTRRSYATLAIVGAVASCFMLAPTSKMAIPDETEPPSPELTHDLKKVIFPELTQQRISFVVAEDTKLTQQHEKQNDKEAVKPPKLNRDQTIDKYFDGESAEIMKAICRSENRVEKEDHIQTGLNKDGTADIGWCQINVDWNADKVPGQTRAEKIESLQNGDINIQVAHKIYVSWGRTFNAWSDYKNGRYQKYMYE